MEDCVWECMVEGVVSRHLGSVYMAVYFEESILYLFEGFTVTVMLDAYICT